MKRCIAIVLVLVIAGLAGCAHHEAEKATPDYEAIEKQLEKEQYEYANAWSTLDMNKISEIWAHDPDITIWGPGERERVQGWEGPNGVKAWYENAMAPMASCDFKIHDLLIKVSTDGTAAVVTYYVENDFVDKDGNAGKMTPRVTVVKELRDGKWKQIHGDASFSIAEINAMQ